MATPSPMSATRYSTITFTWVKVVSATTTRKVATIETAATSRGASANSEPNTNASTTSAPNAPTRVRVSTLVLPELPLPAAVSSSMPVTRTLLPGGSAACSVASSCRPRPLSPPLWKPPWVGGKTSAKVVRPSPETNRRSPPVA
jgi:hypothetical protein